MAGSLHLKANERGEERKGSGGEEQGEGGEESGGEETESGQGRGQGGAQRKESCSLDLGKLEVEGLTFSYMSSIAS